MTIEQARSLLGQIEYRDWGFMIEEEEGEALVLQVNFIAGRDVQKGRKWRISRYISRSELVQNRPARGPAGRGARGARALPLPGQGDLRAALRHRRPARDRGAAGREGNGVKPVSWVPEVGWKWLKWTFGFWIDPANRTLFGIDVGPLEIVWRLPGYRP